MLSITNLSFNYVETDGSQTMPMCFDLEVQRGEILSLIGPSGSGKTSLLNLIAGFILPESGSVTLDDQNILTLKPAERPISIVFQSHNLFPHLDVFTNVALGINPSLKLSDAERQSIEDALVKLGIQDYKKRKPGQLSGGQQQRIALARALVRKHTILLLDEPFAALGPALREELIEILKTLVSQQSMVALMVSHQPSDALLASKRCAFVHQGRVIALSDSDDLLNHSTLSDVQTYLGSV